MPKSPTKQEKREIINNKLKTKKKMGATLASQIQHTQTSRYYSGTNKKQLIKKNK